jgi:hypothetical protein
MMTSGGQVVMSVSANALDQASAAIRPRGLQPWLRATIGLLVLGATLGSALDGIHTHLGVTGYAVPWHWLMARWVPLLFGSAAVGIGLVPVVADLAAYGRVARKGLGQVVTGLLLFVLAYALSGVLATAFAACTWTLAALFALVWSLGDGSRLGLALAVVAAIAGVTVEMTLVHIGAFFYVSPHIAGVPVWLPWLYAIGAVVLGNVGRYAVTRSAR